MNSQAEDLGDLPPAARRSVTFDRGTEFAAYPDLKTSLGMLAYFCAPQAPWQKGAVDRRRHLGPQQRRPARPRRE